MCAQAPEKLVMACAELVRTAVAGMEKVAGDLRDTRKRDSDEYRSLPRFPLETWHFSH